MVESKKDEKMGTLIDQLDIPSNIKVESELQLQGRKAEVS